MPSTSVLASGTILKTNREVQSIDKVRMELLQGEDALSTWIQNELPKKFFLPMDDAIQAKYGEISSRVFSLPCFDMARKTTFLNGADGWLIAAAICTGAVIVTHEQYDVRCRRKILLPNVAHDFNVQCVRIIQVLRNSGAKFHLIQGDGSVANL